MKIFLIACAMLLSLDGFSQTTQSSKNSATVRKAKTTASPKVYICNSSSAYAYHSNENCSGLNRCTHGISAVTTMGAAEKGRRPCKKCY